MRLKCRNSGESNVHPTLPLLPDPLWSWVVEPAKGSCDDQIDLSKTICIEEEYLIPCKCVYVICIQNYLLKILIFHLCTKESYNWNYVTVFKQMVIIR